MYHIPVLLDRCIEGLEIKPGGTYVDATFGGGGHSKAILERLGDGRLIAFDQDLDAVQNIPDDERFLFIGHNYRYLSNFLKLHQAIPVDGILADLGISSHQIDKAERGFSSRFDGMLDMRMNRSQQQTAAEVVNHYSFEGLNKVLKEYGELKNSNRIAGAIVKSREQKPIQTTKELADAIRHCFPQNRVNKGLAMVFQALRIEVNDELVSLREFLRQTVDVLKPHGRLVVISYHSLEDRLVKNIIATGNPEGKLEKDFFGNPLVPFKKITNKPIVPADDEIDQNNRARSAKLRIAEKN